MTATDTASIARGPLAPSSLDEYDRLLAAAVQGADESGNRSFAAGMRAALRLLRTGCLR